MTSEHTYKGNITHFSAFKISDENNLGFTASDYSKFKHGAINIAKSFGYILATKFVESHLCTHYNGKQIVVIPSAYSYIPTASFYMKKFFVEKLNHFLYKMGYPILQETKIDRSVTYREDYGQMSAIDRYNLISQDRFHIDKSYLANKELLFLDDIKITGTHERIIIKMLNDFRITNKCYMLYFAELINPKISPQFENYLNNYSVKNLDDLNNIIKDETFVFNTRVVKYILNAGKYQFEEFLKKQTESFVDELYYNSIGNEYYKFETYRNNINRLEEIVFKDK